MASALYYKKKCVWFGQARPVQSDKQNYLECRQGAGEAQTADGESADHIELRQAEKEASEVLTVMRNMREIAGENAEADSDDDADEESDEELGLRTITEVAAHQTPRRTGFSFKGSAASGAGNTRRRLRFPSPILDSPSPALRKMESLDDALFRAPRC
ncbi:hypothetical protein C8R44DRAFT_736146 [Mycena epipterygia]|nr:hypothetical protein C8R44DRAFT_736146 [Mycena epipterygia]